MANSDAPNGFKPYNGPSSPSGNPVISDLPLLATNTAIGIGTPVAYLGSGVEIAGTTDQLVGIAAEAKAASAGGTIKVYSDPQQLFVAQLDDGTGTLTAALDMGKNTTFVGTGVTNGLSTAELDESAGQTTATLLFKCIKLSDDYGRRSKNAAGEFARVVCKINNHFLGSHTGTAGV